MKRVKIYAAISLLLVLLFALAGYIIQNLSIEELEFLLQNKRVSFSNNATLTITTNLELLRSQLNNTDTDSRYYETEAYSRSIAEWVIDDTPVKTSPLLQLSRSIFNTPLPEQDGFFQKLEYAYWLERHKQCLNAESRYAEILIEHKLPERDYQIIELHRAFCLTSSRRLKSAGDITNTLLMETPYDDIYKTALDLQNFIQSLESAPVIATDNKFDKAMNLYRNMEYETAEDILGKILSEEVNNNAARYYLGRTLEAQGKIQESGVEYKRILLSSTDQWKQLAARRLAMLELFYESGITSSAIEILKEEEPEFLNNTIVDLATIKESPVEETDKSIKNVQVYIETIPEKAQISVNNILAGKSPLFFTAEINSNLQITAETADVSKTIEFATSELDDRILITLSSGLFIDTQLVPKVITLGKIQLDKSLSYKGLEAGNYILTFYGEDQSGNSYLFEKALQLTAGEILKIEL